jgi:hypothetical protein
VLEAGAGHQRHFRQVDTGARRGPNGQEHRS